ncbi:MAG: hypothetical protein ABIO48_12845 [Pedococcus sp.]
MQPNVTLPNFLADIETARQALAEALRETDPDVQRNLALIAQAAGQIAQAEATWLRGT